MTDYAGFLRDSLQGTNSRRLDRWLLWTVLSLAGWGLLMVYSSSCALGQMRHGDDLTFLQAQFFRCVLGVGLLLVVAQLDARILRGRVRWFAWGGLVLMLAVLFLPTDLSVTVRGARRWLRLGGFVLQPSEFARFAMMLMLAGTLADREIKLRSWRGLWLPAGIIGLTAGLVAAQPHMSQALLIAVTGFGLLFLAGASLWRLALLALAALSGAAGLALVTGKGYHLARILSFLKGGVGALGFQPEQSVVAVGSGGLFGLGWGKGLQKFFFLPDPHTDFILSIVAEEGGFVSLVLLFALTGFILWRVFLLGHRCESRFGELFCYGVGLQMLFGSLLHTAVCLGWAPTTGIPFPLVSFGGSALIANLLGLGLVLSVSSRRVEGRDRSESKALSLVRTPFARRRA